MIRVAVSMPAAARKRRAARIVLLNSLRQVLLIRFVIERQQQPFVFWATPGGGVELGETDLEAAQRELAEELGLSTNLTGPVHSVTAEFEHEGERLMNTDVFFLGHCDQRELTLKFATEAERTAMKEIKWWSTVELERTVETVFPADLAKIIRDSNLNYP